MGDNLKLYECDVFQPSTGHILLEFDSLSPHSAIKYLYVKNISEEAQTFTVDSPVSKYVSVEYFVPRGKVLPNTSAQLEIKCSRDLEMRPYYDRIIVKCSKGCGCLIKITLSPKKENAFKIPSEINMGIVPLGEKTTAKLVIPPVQKRMPFMIICSVCCPELTINPVKGTVGDTAVTIEISYNPLAYVTASFPLHLYLPTMSATPYFILVTADTKPGLIGELISQSISKPPEKESSSPFRKFPKSKLPILQTNLDSNSGKDTGWTHHKINLFLMKKDRIDSSPQELLGPLGKPISVEENIKQVKQDEFLLEIEKIKNEESTALIHKSDYITHPPPVDRSLWDLLWQEHEKKNGYRDHVQVEEIQPAMNQPLRPIKPITKDSDHVFTDRKANMWLIRYRSLKRFIQSSRTIIIQNRLLKRLKVLKSIAQKEDSNNDAGSIKSPQ